MDIVEEEWKSNNEVKGKKGDKDRFFFFNDTATTEIYTLSLHDALPIWHHWEFPIHKKIIAMLACSIV